MPITAKDSLPGISAQPTAAGAANTSGGAQAPRGADAVGVEVPVVVHASRNSVAVREIAKPQPPVHEETRTVIVFPQGAVVRLTATLATGELVVLTNRRSGLDVLCRVASVKAQPGIQNYVDLEFTQRAPGFWGDCFPSEHPPAVAAPELPSPPASGGFASLFNKPESLQLTPAPAPERQTAPAIPPAIAAVASSTLPAMRPELPAAPPVAQVTPGNALGMGLTRPPDLPQPWSRSLDPAVRGGESASGSRKVVLMAVAAVVLLSAMGGGIVLLRQGRSAALATAQSSAATQGLPAPPAAIPQGSSLSEKEEVAPATQNPAATARVDARASLRSSEPAVTRSAEEPSRIAAKPKEPPRESVARVIAKLSAPVAKKSLPSSSSEPPPVLPASVAGPVENSLLLSSEQSSGPVSPAAAARAATFVGGRVLQPKLISSPAPTYPPQATVQRIQGEVVVDALVDVKGRVTEAKAISGSPLLQQAAINAVRTWKYEPARLDGEPVAAHTQVRLSFRLP